jgi:hypothetical protein
VLTVRERKEAAFARYALGAMPDMVLLLRAARSDPAWLLTYTGGIEDNGDTGGLDILGLLASVEPHRVLWLAMVDQVRPVLDEVLRQLPTHEQAARVRGILERREQYPSNMKGAT